MAEQTSRDHFLKELRERTSEYHDKLEETPLSGVILSEEVTREAYVDYLKVMYAYTKPFEETYFPVLGDIFSALGERKRAHLLEKDLLVLGISREALETLAASERHDVPEGLSEAVGSMYVLEGSSLGGRVIYKHIHKKLGLTEDTGASYFYGHGSGTGPMWTSFLDELWQFAAQHPQEKIFSGAVSTFRDMYHLFSREEKYAI